MGWLSRCTEGALIIREALPCDLPVALDLRKKLSEGLGSVNDELVNAVEFSCALFDDWCGCWLALEGNTVAGMIWGKIQFSMSGSNVGLLSDVIIVDRYQGRNVGSWLLEEIEDWFNECGVDSIEVRVKRDLTSPLHAFYLKKGYRLEYLDGGNSIYMYRKAIA